MKLLVILQCAYATSQERRKQLADQRLWEAALWRSHSGKRLLSMLPPGCELRVINASTQIGKQSSDTFSPEPDHIAAVYAKYQPDAVLACGRVAHEGARLAGLPYIPAPHPAWRALSSIQCEQIRLTVENYLGALPS